MGGKAAKRKGHRKIGKGKRGVRRARGRGRWRGMVGVAKKRVGISKKGGDGEKKGGGIKGSSGGRGSNREGVGVERWTQKRGGKN